jgi:hypothetical protein
MTTAPDLRLAGFKTAIAPDGSEVAFTFLRADRTETTVKIPFNDLAEFILGLEAQAGEAAAKLSASLRGVDRRLMMPVKKRDVTKLQGAVARGGLPILTVELDGRLQLDMTFQAYQIQDLVEWLEQLRSQTNMEPTKPN